MGVAVGQQAPSFSLYDTEKKLRTLAEFGGKNTVLAFYPGAFTGVCTKEMCTFRDAMANFNTMNAQVIGVSVDGVFANKAFAAQNNIQFPLLSDFKREAVAAYGLEHKDFSGLSGYTASKRSVFVIDKGGVVRYAWVSENPSVEPNYEEVTKAVAALK